MIEEWRDVVGYEGIYQVSNLGSVRSLLFNKTKILKQGCATNGYLFVNLWKNKKARPHRIHRLVAEAFLPNPNNLPCVNHKDETRDNNILENLEWCSYSYNLSYGSRAEKCIATRNARKGHSAEKIVLQCDMQGNVIKEWKSLMELSRNGIRRARIQECFSGKRKVYKGYLWLPKSEYENAMRIWNLIEREEIR